RQALAARLGYSETVFVDDPERGVLDNRTPGTAPPFAGHPLVGGAGRLARPDIAPPAGPVVARGEGVYPWTPARAGWGADRVP
ncbi:PhzF family phenazine biosynthesis protein, partial [Streptomyces sp. DT18]